MFFQIGTRFALVLALFSTILIAGCGDREPEQRQAFATFLQSRIIWNHEPNGLPVLTEANKKAMGPYADQYKVLIDFNEGMKPIVKDLTISVSTLGKIYTPKDLLENSGRLPIMLAQIAEIQKETNALLVKANVARDALKQPPDLKTVYDQAFTRSVTNQAKAMQDTLARLLLSTRALESMAQFLNANRAHIQISGITVEVANATLLKKFGYLQNHYALQQQGLMSSLNTLRLATQ